MILQGGIEDYTVASRTGVPKKLHSDVKSRERAEPCHVHGSSRTTIPLGDVIDQRRTLLAHVPFLTSSCSVAPPSGRAQLFPIFAAFEIKTMTFRPPSAFSLYANPPTLLTFPLVTPSTSPQCTPRVSIAV
jgi:hypothetical protein